MMQYRWFILAVALLVYWFYWTQWRPVPIIAKCNEIAKIGSAKLLKVQNSKTAQADYSKAYAQSFTECMRKSGIK